MKNTWKRSFGILAVIMLVSAASLIPSMLNTSSPVPEGCIRVSKNLVIQLLARHDNRVVGPMVGRMMVLHNEIWVPLYLEERPRGTEFIQTP